MKGAQLSVPLGFVLLACQSAPSDRSAQPDLAQPDLAQPSAEPVAIFAEIGGVT